MKIRTALAGDAVQIAGFWNPMIRDTFVTFNSVQKTPGEIVELIEQSRRAGCEFVLASEGGDILGFAFYRQFRAGAGYVKTMEHTVILAPAAQGCGVGRALMERIEQHAAQAGAHSMIAGVSGNNQAGISFHEAMGYREIAILPEVGRKFDRWLNLHLMQKLLRSG